MNIYLLINPDLLRTEITYTNRQKEIIDAAIQLISERGIQSLTIKNLASKLNLTEGAIYRHFRSKDEILNGIVKFLDEIRIQAAERINSVEGGTAEKLRQFFLCCFTRFTQKPELASVVFAEEIFRFSGDMSKQVYKIMQSTQQIVRNIIIQGKQNKEVSEKIDDFYGSMLITGAMRLLVTQWRMSGFAFDLIDEGNKLLENILETIK